MLKEPLGSEAMLKNVAPRPVTCRKCLSETGGAGSGRVGNHTFSSGCRYCQRFFPIPNQFSCRSETIQLQRLDSNVIGNNVLRECASKVVQSFSCQLAQHRETLTSAIRELRKGSRPCNPFLHLVVPKRYFNRAMLLQALSPEFPASQASRAPVPLRQMLS